MRTTATLTRYKKTIAFLTITTLISTSMLLMSQVNVANGTAPGDDQKKDKNINSTDASKFISNYSKNASKVKAVVKGVIVEPAQLEALNDVAATHPDAKYYRLYFGTDDTGADVAIAVATDENGNDMTDNMYSTARTGTNLCPPMCDATGTLTGQ